MKNSFARALLLTAVLCVVASTAIGAGVSLTLESSRSVDEQAEALAEYVLQLPKGQQAEWLGNLQNLAAEIKTEYSPTAPKGDAHTVYISGSGARYHWHNTCQGLVAANSIYSLTKDSAIEMNKTPCKICYPDGN